MSSVQAPDDVVESCLPTSHTVASYLLHSCRLANECARAPSLDSDVRAIGVLEKTAELAQVANVISDNEELREISTPSLRVLFIASMQVAVESNARVSQDSEYRRERLHHLENAVAAARRFAQDMDRLKVLPPPLLALLLQRVTALERSSVASPDDTTALGIAADKRQLKIRLLRLDREMRRHLKTYKIEFYERVLRLGVCEGSEDITHPRNMIEDPFYDLLMLNLRNPDDFDEFDDESGEPSMLELSQDNATVPQPKSVREYLLLNLALHALHTISLLDSAGQEFAILRSTPEVVQPPTEPRDDGDRTWRVDPSLIGASQGPLLSQDGRPLRPFTITPSAANALSAMYEGPGSARERLQGQVFRPSHRLPTMSIDEFLAEEQRRGNIIPAEKYVCVLRMQILTTAPHSTMIRRASASSWTAIWKPSSPKRSRVAKLCTGTSTSRALVAVKATR